MKDDQCLISLSGKNSDGKKFAIVDNDNFDKLSKYSWYYTLSGYAARSSGKNKTIYMHRFI